MREIKFRAWIPEEKSMVEVLVIDWHWGNISFARNEKDKEWATIPTNNLDKVALMQYTGLKDSKGREIYEGDIATVECECGYKANMPVGWGYNGWRLEKQWSHRFPSGELEFNHTERVEVIGDIYENPELLKEIVNED